MKSTLPQTSQEEISRTSSRRRSTHRKKLGPVAKAIKWLKKNPLKLTAILLLIVLIYLTILFFQFGAKTTPHVP